MRWTALALMTLVLAGCARDGDGGAAPPAAKEESGLSSTTASGPSPRTSTAGRPPIDVIAGLVCDDPATRLSGDPEAPNGSWECARDGEPIRIDFHVDEDEQRAAGEVTLASYRSAGDNRPWAELPLVCGPRFGIRADSVASRDALIATLTEAEVEASTCG